jgi:hypothetical protein
VGGNERRKNSGIASVAWWNALQQGEAASKFLVVRVAAAHYRPGFVVYGDQEIDQAAVASSLNGPGTQAAHNSDLYEVTTVHIGSVTDRGGLHGTGLSAAGLLHSAPTMQIRCPPDFSCIASMTKRCRNTRPLSRAALALVAARAALVGDVVLLIRTALVWTFILLLLLLVPLRNSGVHRLQFLVLVVPIFLLAVFV